MLSEDSANMQLSGLCHRNDLLQLRNLELFLELAPKKLPTMSRPEKLAAVVAEAISYMDKMSKQSNRLDCLSVYFQGLQPAATATMDVDTTSARSPVMASVFAGGNLGALVLAQQCLGHDAHKVQSLQLVLRLLQYSLPTSSIELTGVLTSSFRGPDGVQLVPHRGSLAKRLTLQLATMEEGLIEEWIQTKLVEYTSPSSASARVLPSSPTPPGQPISAESSDDKFAVWRLAVQLLRFLLASSTADAEHDAAKKDLSCRIWSKLRKLLWSSVAAPCCDTTARIFALLEWIALEHGQLGDLVKITLDLLQEVAMNEDKLNIAAPTLQMCGSVFPSSFAAAPSVSILLDFLQRALDSCTLAEFKTLAPNVSDQRSARSGMDSSGADDHVLAVDCEIEDAEVSINITKPLELPPPHLSNLSEQPRLNAVVFVRALCLVGRTQRA